MRGGSEKMVLWFMSESVWPLISSKSFIVSGLIFRFLILSLFLCMVLGSVLISFFYMRLSSFPSTTYWTSCIFSIIYSCLLCHRLVGRRCMGWILAFLSCSTYLYFCLCASTISFWWLLLCSIVWSLGAWFLQLHFFFFRMSLVILGLLCFQTNLKYFVWVLWKVSLVIW